MMAMTDRQDGRVRAQLCVPLGDGNAGRERKRIIEAAASQAGRTVSSWARQVLCVAAGLPGAELVSRGEYEALELRVRRLEGREP